MKELSEIAPRVSDRAERMLDAVRRNVPPGLRSLIGALLIVGGIFGFLPILGLWMIPLGIAVIGIDVQAIRQALRGRADRQRRNRSKDLR